MNNEPVAWMQTLLDGHTGEVKHTLEFIRVGINDIPLYTHPAKELTDEEILKVWRENERVYPMDRSRLLDRTRACIRKALAK